MKFIRRLGGQLSPRLCISVLALLPSLARADSVLSPAGPVARGDATILIDATVIMLAIVIPTMIATLAFAWWYRASNTRAVYRPDFEYSGKVELVVWSIPTLTIFFLGGVIWIGSHKLDPFEPIASPMKPLEIEAVSFDWKWLFIYPEQKIATVNELVVPVGRPLHFRITSASVFNAFFVPRLGSLIYAMNGMVSQLNLQADQPGKFLGYSAQFSGDGFPDMRFDPVAMPQDKFASWAAGVTGAPLDRNAVAQLLKQTSAVKPYTYKGVDPAIFDAITAEKVIGEGPQSDRGRPETQKALPQGGKP